MKCYGLKVCTSSAAFELVSDCLCVSVIVFTCMHTEISESFHNGIFVRMSVFRCVCIHVRA